MTCSVLQRPPISASATSSAWALRFCRNAAHRLVARHRAGTQRAKEVGLVLDDGAVRLLGRGERKPRDAGRIVDDQAARERANDRRSQEEDRERGLRRDAAGGQPPPARRARGSMKSFSCAFARFWSATSGAFVRRLRREVFESGTGRLFVFLRRPECSRRGARRQPKNAVMLPCRPSGGRLQRRLRQFHGRQRQAENDAQSRRVILQPQRSAVEPGHGGREAQA